MTACMNEPDLGIATFASCTVEVHALVLGISVGLVSSLALYLGYDRSSLLILVVTVIPSVMGISVHPVVEMKPWYLAFPAVMITFMAAVMRDILR